MFDGTKLGPVLRGSTGPDQPAASVLTSVRAAIDELLSTRTVLMSAASESDAPALWTAGPEWWPNRRAWGGATCMFLPRSAEGSGCRSRWTMTSTSGPEPSGETGRGVGAASMLYVSVGTGVASRHFTLAGTERGGSQLAGEMGFVPVGRDSLPLERVASGRAISDAYCRETGRTLSVAQIVASLSEDRVAARVWSTAMDALAHGLATGVCLSDPEIVVLGGGLSNAGRELLEAVGPRLEALLAPLRPSPPITLAVHGDLSGVVGAALHGGLWTSRTA